MKQPVLLFCLVFFIACNPAKQEKQEQKQNGRSAPITSLLFKNEMHNFSPLEAREIVLHSFIFTNTGESDLWINNIDTGCGCMSATYPEKPIKPGEKGTITVEFNTSGLHGKQMKTITVEANVPKPKHLTIFAEVKNEQLKFNL